MPIKLIGPFRQLLPMTGLPLRGALTDDQLPVLEEAGILVEKGKVLEVGKFEDLSRTAREANCAIEELQEDLVGIPGLIDCHTHICFGGSRAGDYALRNAGTSYLEIARQGGGIWSSVTQTRSAGESELVKGLLERAKRLLAQGVTTAEVKSGYGLEREAELKMLRAIRRAAERTPLYLVPTFLGAHTLPKDFEGDHRAYLQHLLQELLPEIKDRGLARRVDIFVEETAFSPELALPYLQAAREMGFALTVHADQFTPGGSGVAIAAGAISADHLEASGAAEIAALARSNVIPVALPGASLGLGCAFPPARKLLDAGCALAIASDWNPGSAPMGHLLTQATVLGAFEKLTNAEVLAGITFRAAAALQLPKRGRLNKGDRADLVAFPTRDYREITWRQGQLPAAEVWVEGRQVLSGSA